MARNRVAAGAADFLRNLGLLFVAAPLVEPLSGLGERVPPGPMALSLAVGVALFAISLILDYGRKE